MSTVKTTYLQNASASSPNITLDANNNATFAGTVVASSPLGFRNKIINGAMEIDQRNAGASVTIGASTGTYTVDRWGAQSVNASKFSVQQNAGSVIPPAGFKNYLGITSLAATSSGSTDYYSLYQPIEGVNIVDLAWGTANAKAVTVSFWVYSSITGTFSASLANSGASRSYPFTFVINASNTWEYKTITIAGDTTGTWLTTNGIGVYLRFDLGCGSSFRGTANAWAAANYYGVTSAVSMVGTNGATFYLTGIQLEVGTAATPFERRNFQQELAMCQRYFQAFGGSAVYEQIGYGVAATTTSVYCGVPFTTTMRTIPSVSISNSSANDFTLDYGNNNTRAAGIATSSIAANAGMSTQQGRVTVTLSTAGVTAQQFLALLSYAGATGRLEFSAEL